MALKSRHLQKTRLESSPSLYAKFQPQNQHFSPLDRRKRLVFEYRLQSLTVYRLVQKQAKFFDFSTSAPTPPNLFITKF